MTENMDTKHIAFFYDTSAENISAHIKKKLEQYLKLHCKTVALYEVDFASVEIDSLFIEMPHCIAGIAIGDSATNKLEKYIVKIPIFTISQFSAFKNERIINLFPSVRTIAELLGKLSYLIAAQSKEEVKKVIFLIDDAIPKNDEEFKCDCGSCKTECECAFKYSISSFSVNYKVSTIYYTEDNLNIDLKDKESTIYCVYGFSKLYVEMIKNLLEKNCRVITDFNVKEDFIEDPNLVGYICSLEKSVNLSFFSSLVESIAYMILLYRESGDVPYDTMQYYQSSIGTFYLNEGKDFFLPLQYYIKDDRLKYRDVDFLENSKKVSIVNATAKLSILSSIIQNSFKVKSSHEECVSSLHGEINKIIVEIFLGEFFSGDDVCWHDGCSPSDILEKNGLICSSISNLDTNAVLQVPLFQLDLEDNDTYRFYDESNNRLILNECANIKKIKYMAKSRFSENKFEFDNPLNDNQIKNIMGFIKPCIENKKCCYLYYFYFHTTNKNYSIIRIKSNNKYSKTELNILKNILQITFWGVLEQKRSAELMHVSMKTAKSAIMARNISHNLGSHVMFYIKQKLQSVEKIKEGGVLCDLYNPNKPISFSVLSDFMNSTLTENRTELPFLVGLGRFINYLQERHDYVAIIPTDYHPAYSTVNFKDFIYDELKPDLRHERHKNIKGIKPQNLLLDFIAYSEGYSKSDDIVLRYGDFDGKIPDNEDKKTSFEELRKINVSLPGGVMGRQAIFSILENIIRNAAKHCTRTDKNKINIYFNQVKLEKSTFEDVISLTRLNENGTKVDQKADELYQCYLKTKDKYFLLKITVDMPNEEDDITKLIGFLLKPYISEEGRVDDSAKGLKEMRISASWLRGYFSDLSIPLDEPPAILIRKEKFAGDKYKILYYICLPKPKQVAFIVDAETSLNNYDESNMKSHNSIVIRVEKGNENNESKQTEKYIIADYAKKIADYDMVVFCADNDRIKKLIPYLSSRYIPYEEKNIKILQIFFDEIVRLSKDKTLKNNLMSHIYQSWYEQRFASAYKCTELTILDEKTLGKKINSLKDNRYQDILLSTTGTSEKNFYDNKIIFSTHYEKFITPSEREARGKYNNAKFVESITGHNSTDRLIRQSEWNEEWKFKHLAAGLLRIAIFDERLFDFAMPLVPASEKVSATQEQQEKIYNQLEEALLKNSSKDGQYNEIYKIITTIFSQLENIIEASKSILSASTAVERREIVKNLYRTDSYDINNAQLYHEKRVWFYNIKKDKLGNQIDIIGYNALIDDAVGKFLVDERNVCRVARIIKKKTKTDVNEYSIEMDKDKDKDIKLENKFDLMTVHQGILDKIYGHFNISDNKNEKYKVTHIIHKFFSNRESPIEPTAYLPSFIIHSGRSKPSEENMPQDQPFIQFSTLDHAVKDCKYTLSELLLSAYYE